MKLSDNGSNGLGNNAWLLRFGKKKKSKAKKKLTFKPVLSRWLRWCNLSLQLRQEENGIDMLQKALQTVIKYGTKVAL